MPLSCKYLIAHSTLVLFVGIQYFNRRFFESFTERMRIRILYRAFSAIILLYKLNLLCINSCYSVFIEFRYLLYLKFYNYVLCKFNVILSVSHRFGLIKNTL